jgi:hypothetical protein
LRQEVSLKAPVSATVRHGEPLDILEFKRRFIKVRTAGGITGWTDARQLLTPEQMSDLQRVTDRAGSFPSQGTAVTFEAINVHVEPNRNSPSFVQVPENGKVEIIGHKLLVRNDAPPTIPMPPPRPKAPRGNKKKDKNASRVPPPPMPEAPKPPSNWLELSQTEAALPAPRPDLKPAAPKNTTPPAPPRLDDWSLIRTLDGKVGWVLSRMVNMALPDDMLRYAEGHRITSYFVMADVHDDELNQTKHHWLWTTVGKGAHEYEFDSYRFFIWSRHRHRYETAFIQKNVVGHYPIRVSTGNGPPSFTVIVDDDDGKPVTKTYAFNGSRVVLTDTAPYQPPAFTQPQSSRPNLALAQTQLDQKPQGWYDNMKSRVSKMFHR